MLPVACAIESVMILLNVLILTTFQSQTLSLVGTYAQSNLLQMPDSDGEGINVSIGEESVGLGLQECIRERRGLIGGYHLNWLGRLDHIQLPTFPST